MSAAKTAATSTAPLLLDSAFRVCARPALVAEVRAQYGELGGWRAPHQVPMVYNDIYNIGFMGIERFHPFDSHKFGKVVRALGKAKLVSRDQLVEAKEASQEVLADVHTEKYLKSLNKGKWKLAEITEAWLIVLLPNFLIQSRMNRPMRFHVGGSILAAALALEYGWAINIGGGMHHANFEDGSGWCAYSDLSLAMRKLRKASNGKVQKFMIVDLDVHQGNGHERDKLHFADPDVHILDIYNCDIWPGDTEAKAAIDTKVEVHTGMQDAAYLQALAKALADAFQSFQPDFVIYNAGTDILLGDPLGKLKVTAAGVAKRDEMVFQAALDHQVPICMYLSGGYAKNSAAVIGQCISHLLNKFELVPGASAGDAKAATSV
ncbi:hypothetical protein WJX72_004978 [[Myrmecia] bisecta]|uniref:histone deacetylase n=1 Tax=[Myrmecia] bisecta TaxID=41462 RepID=A0AAW1R5L8_9CHLO